MIYAYKLDTGEVFIKKVTWRDHGAICFAILIRLYLSRVPYIMIYGRIPFVWSY